MNEQENVPRSGHEKKTGVPNERRSVRMPKTHKVPVAAAQRGTVLTTLICNNTSGRSPSTNIPTPPGITCHTHCTHFRTGRPK